MAYNLTITGRAEGLQEEPESAKREVEKVTAEKSISQEMFKVI